MKEIIPNWPWFRSVKCTNHLTHKWCPHWLENTRNICYAATDDLQQWGWIDCFYPANPKSLGKQAAKVYGFDRVWYWNVLRLTPAFWFLISILAATWFPMHQKMNHIHAYTFMYIYIYMYTRIYIYHISIYIYITYIYICNICIHVYTYVTHTYVYIYTHVWCIHIYIYIYM